jgi:hypothetical protein
VYGVDMRDRIIITSCGCYGFALAQKEEKPKRSISKKLLQSLKFGDKKEKQKNNVTNSMTSCSTINNTSGDQTQENGGEKK